MRPGLWTVLLLSMISYLITDGRVIKPNLEAKYQLQQSVLSSEEESAMQYSIMSPAVTYAVQKMIGVVIMNNQKIRLYSFEVVTFISFIALYLLFYLYLRVNYDEKRSVQGLIMLQALLLYFIQNNYHESSLFNMIFFTMGMLIIAMRKDALLPLIVLTGSLNQPQIIGLMLFYMILRFSEGNLMRFQTAAVVIISVISWVLAESVLKSFYGIRTGEFAITGLHSNIPLLILCGMILLTLAVRGLPGSAGIFRMSVFFIPLAVLLTFMLVQSPAPLDFAYIFIFVIPPVINLFVYNPPVKA